ncbi:hypothetical protein J6590_020191 [Homalodisca vitripennis]|nr:hypothetical protein J6590_020191 [Homalodisca vitripennis]
MFYGISYCKTATTVISRMNKLKDSFMCNMTIAPWISSLNSLKEKLVESCKLETQLARDREIVRLNELRSTRFSNVENHSISARNTCISEGLLYRVFNYCSDNCYFML